MMKKQVRTRIAPSPTGQIHIGTARTALYSWLHARKHNGTFILRIEDTDRERSRKEYERSIIDGLNWLNLTWDEFYRQSDRRSIYSGYIEQLLKQEKAFWCNHSKEELTTERKKQEQDNEAPRHLCDQKNRSLDGGQIIRLNVDKIDGDEIIFSDEIRGNLSFRKSLIGDFAIAKNLDEPLFHLVVVIDDYEMLISDVIRGEEHLSNTPKHVMLQRALGIEIPNYAHLPIILAPDGSKLSKRNDSAKSLIEFKEEGYLAPALVNYLAILGFTLPDVDEVKTIDELISVFNLSLVHKKSAIFDVKKLDWFNSQYISKLTDSELLEYINPVFRDVSVEASETLSRAIPFIRERIVKLSDALEFAYLFNLPDYEAELLLRKTSDSFDTKKLLKLILDMLKYTSSDDSGVTIKAFLEDMSREAGGRGPVYWPFRVALSGVQNSPDPVDLLKILGREESATRVGIAIEKLD